MNKFDGLLYFTTYYFVFITIKFDLIFFLFVKVKIRNIGINSKS